MNQAALRAKNAPGPRRLVLAPGNYGLDYLASALPQFERFPVVKTSNFIGDTLDMAATAKFEEVLLVGHVGKLCKLAAGVMNTHSHTADGRAEVFCAHAALCGAAHEVCAALMDAATTCGLRCWKACCGRSSSTLTGGPAGRSGWGRCCFPTSTARWARQKRQRS